jgi:hypothetical protein
MYTACFDASGTERDTRFLVFGGFVSTSDYWIKFSQDWKERLAKDGLKYFRTEECAHFKNDFKRYRHDENGRQALQADLMRIIRRYAFRKFAGVLENSLFQAGLSRAAREKFHQSAYVLGGREIANMVRLWMKAERMSDPENWGRPPLQLVYEKGDEGQGLLRERLLAEGYVEPQFRYRTDRFVKGQFHPGFTPLQAADFLAYEVFQFLKNPKTPKERWPFQEFTRMPGPMLMGSISTLKQMEQMMNVNEAVRGWILQRQIPMR